MQVNRTSTTLKIGKLRESQFMKTLEKLMKKHPNWSLTVELESEGWFSKTWKLTVNHPYMLTNLMFALDSTL